MSNSRPRAENLVDPRGAAIRQWLADDLGVAVETLTIASADASFRRYWRAALPAGATRIIMDAPPDKEDIEPYLRVAALMSAAGVHVPQVYAVDRARGFVLLEDLGTESYLQALQANIDAERLYASALDELLKLQLAGSEVTSALPPYDGPVLDREMALLREWYCDRHLHMSWSAEDSVLLDNSLAWIRDQVLLQPRVFVHRDYHSRNLMRLAGDRPGVIDFQDALAGPIGYDLVSLFKDCYIRWPRARVLGWLRHYRARLLADPRGQALAGSSDAEFVRWFDLVGLQRHIKVLGIFARLWHRDGKRGYLADLPLTLLYVRDAAARYTELRDFSLWVERRLLPDLAFANARELAR
jgi:hypothetical protein